MEDLILSNASTNNWGSSAAGYDGNGIIVLQMVDEFYAYDRTCPHDYAVNGLSIKVNIDFTIAVCPKCGTTYALVSKWYTRFRYWKISLEKLQDKLSTDSYVRVWNNFTY